MVAGEIAAEVAEIARRNLLDLFVGQKLEHCGVLCAVTLDFYVWTATSLAGQGYRSRCSSPLEPVHRSGSLRRSMAQLLAEQRSDFMAPRTTLEVERPAKSPKSAKRAGDGTARVLRSRTHL